MFSLGVVMIGAATLNRYPELYDWDSGTMNKGNLNKTLRLIQENYSKKIIHFLK